MAGLGVQRGARILTAARRQYQRALAFHQAHRAVLGIPKCLAGTQHTIEPGLELAGDAEVVQRHGQHDEIVRQEFLDQRIGTRRQIVLVGVALGGIGHPAAHLLAVEVRKIERHDIALGELDIVALFELRLEMCRQRT